MSGTLRVALDIGGVISKYPSIMRSFASSLMSGGAEVFVITDMQDRAAVVGLLVDNGFGFIPSANVRCADYDTHAEGCKAELLRELEIDILLDDHIGYVAIGGSPVRCLVMPDAAMPYYADEWKAPGTPGFGRRAYSGPMRR